MSIYVYIISSILPGLSSSLGRRAFAGIGCRSCDPSAFPRASQSSGVLQSKSSLSNNSRKEEKRRSCYGDVVK